MQPDSRAIKYRQAAEQGDAEAQSRGKYIGEQQPKYRIVTSTVIK